MPSRSPALPAAPVVTAAIVTLSVLLGGCTAPLAGSDPTGTPRATRLVSPSGAPAGSFAPGAVPEALLDAARADASARTGVEAAAVTVVRAEPATWNDGSRGCPEPGVGYTQALVEGYWVVLEAGGTTLDYRISRTGDLRRCEHLGHAGSTP